MLVPGARRPTNAAVTAGRSLYRTTVEVVLTGFAVIVPLVVTLYVLKAAYGFISGALDPFIRLLQYADLISGVKAVGLFRTLIEAGVVEDQVDLVPELAALVVLAALIVTVGVVARHRYGERPIDYFDAVLMAVPGIGAVYKSFRRMGDVVIESDASNFREVKLVEFPHDDSYVIGFETNESPPAVTDAAGEEEMTTLFLPLAPNPFMGGFLAHLPPDQVREIDMTVEEGVRSVVTSGIATPEGPQGRDTPRLSVRSLGDADSIEQYLPRDRGSDEE